MRSQCDARCVPLMYPFARINCLYNAIVVPRAQQRIFARGISMSGRGHPDAVLQIFCDTNEKIFLFPVTPFDGMQEESAVNLETGKDDDYDWDAERDTIDFSVDEINEILAEVRP